VCIGIRVPSFGTKDDTTDTTEEETERACYPITLHGRARQGQGPRDTRRDKEGYTARIFTYGQGKALSKRVPQRWREDDEDFGSGPNDTFALCFTSVFFPFRLECEAFHEVFFCFLSTDFTFAPSFFSCGFFVMLPSFEDVVLILAVCLLSVSSIKY
jgi:hypothetical protein